MIEKQQQEDQELINKDQEGEQQERYVDIASRSVSERSEKKQDIDKLIKQVTFENEQNFVVYRYRYVIVGLFILANLAISIQQNTFAPQGCYLAQIYHVPTILVSMTSLIHLILYAPVSFPANYIIDTHGPKLGIMIAAIFCIFGSWIRCLINHSYYYALLGQFCVGIANPFVINSLNKISALWFRPSDRPGVTAVLSFCVSVTGLIGIIMPGIWFEGFNIHEEGAHKRGRELQYSLNLTQALMITAMMIPNMLFFKDKPPTPPSHSALIEKADFSEALVILQNSTDYKLICISFAIYYGCFNLIGAILSFVLKPFGLVDPIQTSILSVIPIFSGIIGCIISANYLKRSQKFKFTTLLCMVGVSTSLMFFLLMLWTEIFVLILLPTFFLGLFTVPLIPTMLEFACETCFPVGEATSTGFLFASAHLFGGLVGLVETLILGNSCSKNDALTRKELLSSQSRIMITFGFMELLFLIGFILIFFVKEDLKRFKAEKENNSAIKSESSLKL